MKLGIASAILCTALLASLCQAIPSPEYWSYKMFLDQLEGQDAIQQDHHIGSDVEALIEQSKNYACSAKNRFCMVSISA